MLGNVLLPFFLPIPDGIYEFWAAVFIVVIVESLVLWKAFAVSWKRAVWIVFVVNTLSTLIGGFVAFFLSAALSAPIFNPKDLIEYSRQITVSAIATYILCLVLSILLEWWGINERIRKQNKSITKKQTFKVTLIANLISYILLCPWHYYTSHKQYFREVEYKSDWAITPTEKLYFLDEDKYLCSIHTDGKDKQTLITSPIKGYIVSQDLKYCVYWQEDNKLYIYNSETSQTKQITTLYKDGKYDPHFEAYMNKFATPNNIAISPENKWIVWTTSNNSKYDSFSDKELPKSKIYYYDIQAGKSFVYSVSGFAEQTAFSEDGSIVYLQCAPKPDHSMKINVIHDLVSVKISSDNSLFIKQEEPDNLELAACYGRFGDYGYSGDDIRYHRSFKIQQGVYSFRYAGFRLEINGSRKRFNDTHFLMPRYFGTMKSPTLLENRQEIVVEARGGIYLMDISERKFGLITSGSDYIMKSDVWDKKILFKSEDY
ncbi:MAG: hypothetical protein ACIAQZ_01400 [Sedimentisphaeraceae bacterium JB056]